MSGESILERVMLALEGDEVPRWVEKRLAEAPVAGVTLFMAVNVLRPGQVRALTEQFQRAGAGGDAAVYPPGIPAVATYSILPDALEALARALAGEIGFTGRLPIARLSR